MIGFWPFSLFSFWEWGPHPWTSPRHLSCARWHQATKDSSFQWCTKAARVCQFYIAVTYCDKPPPTPLLLQTSPREREEVEEEEKTKNKRKNSNSKKLTENTWWSPWAVQLTFSIASRETILRCLDAKARKLFLKNCLAPSTNCPHKENRNWRHLRRFVFFRNTWLSLAAKAMLNWSYSHPAAGRAAGVVRKAKGGQEMCHTTAGIYFCWSICGLCCWNMHDSIAHKTCGCKKACSGAA